MAIRSWGNSAARRLFETGSTSLRGVDVGRALRRMAELNAISRLDQIAALKSVGLHALKGSRKGQWAVNVNARWRICFRFRDGHAYDVEIVDYHKG